MIRRTLILGATLLAAVCLGAGAAAPARAASPDAQMRQSLLVLRGLIDREGAARYFAYPAKSTVRYGHLGGSAWPFDPWTGARLSAGAGRGHYQYWISGTRRRYRLTGYLGDGRAVVLAGGMPRSIKLAYDHRGEEGINLIRQYVEEYAAEHSGRYPLPAEVDGDGAVGNRHYWPSNPWDHYDMAQRGDRGSFSYEVSADRTSYVLRLHRALKNDYVLRGAIMTSPWRHLLASLEDEILRRSGRVLAGYVGQWSLQHAGTLPTVTEMTPADAVGAAHPDWPQDLSGVAMQPGAGPGAYSYAPGAAGAYILTVHLHSGDFQAGGTAPSPAAPALSAGSPES
jgi:hypothetical protein